MVQAPSASIFLSAIFLSEWQKDRGQKNDGSHYVIDLPAPIFLPANHANRREFLYSRGFTQFVGKKIFAPRKELERL
jgi:hypothetical protein